MLLAFIIHTFVLKAYMHQCTIQPWADGYSPETVPAIMCPVDQPNLDRWVFVDKDWFKEHCIPTEKGALCNEWAQSIWEDISQDRLVLPRAKHGSR